MASACTQTHLVLEPVIVSIGNAHACTIAARALYCWGQNDHGQLGVGDTDNHLSPMRVAADAEWLAVATGENSTLALKVDGSMWSFGGNDEGQLGQGSGDFSSRTMPVQIGDRSDWKAIAIRFKHACALRQDGELWCWGWNFEGQLGQNDIPPPKNESGVADLQQVTKEHDFAMVDAGDGHTCAIKTDGTLWCWGRNSESELARANVPPDDQIRGPVQVGADTDWTVVRSGQSTTCGVRGGRAYCWGQSVTDKDVGGVDMAIPGVAAGANVSMPIDIHVPGVVVDLSFNTFGGAALDDKGGAWVWGRNGEGQLGLGNMAEYSGVIPATGSGWTQVSAGRFTTCGVRGSQPVCAGKNTVGQLGRGNVSDSENTFVVVTLPP